MSPALTAVRRAGNRLRRLVRGGEVDFFYSLGYQVDLGGLPADPSRGERILAFLLAEGLLRPGEVLRPPTASLRVLRQVHSEEYLESLRSPAALAPIIGGPVWDQLHQRALQAQREAVGGTVLATRRALAGRRVAVNLGGGFHHAAPDRGGGFCIFNDVAVAIRRARGRGFAEPVLVVDLDLHDGNGTRAVFARDPSVFTLSIHNHPWDDDEAEGSLSVALGEGVDDETYLDAVRRHLPPLLESVAPELVIYLAGTDPAHDDRIGDWRITAAGMLERDRLVVSAVRRRHRPLPLVVALAGGYGTESWRYSARFFGWLLGGREVEPPPTAEQTVARYRRLAQGPGPPAAARRPAHDWGLTEEDVYGGFGLGFRQSRLLGRLTLHEVELGLERTGFLERLRSLGFAHPTLRFELDNPAGHTVRIFSGPDERELLSELRVRLDRRALPEMTLLGLEWVLLQNPRAAFSDGRPPLPGQRHPGLGLLGDVVALLILLAERLELDGILFVPSHYHLAATSKRYLRFVDPADEAWYRAVERALAALPLAEATAALEQGRVVDRATGRPQAWRPRPMMLPVSDRLRRRIEGETYEAAVAAAARGLDFALDGRAATAAPPIPAGRG